MKKLLSASLLMVFVFGLFSCSSNDNGTQEKPKNSIEIPISGTYAWNFTIPGVGDQTSEMTFNNKEIDYKMTGKAYNNHYKMIIESYDKENMKIVAVGKGGEGKFNKDGHYFAIFLKDIQNNTVLIYKKDDCKSKEEAEAAMTPSEEDSKNHGWNIYTKQ